MADTDEDKDGAVLVTGSASGFTQHIVVGRHRLVSDEPIASGGSDAGPDPYAFLLAALGTCTSMTLGAYARRKRIPLVSVTVRLHHGKIHAEDCTTCETTTGLVDRIERELDLEGPLDAEQRAHLLEIAEKCPVHRTLTSEIQIVTRLADAKTA